MALAYDPAEQAKRRRRERISQEQIAKLLNIAISKVSEYEVGRPSRKQPPGRLPWELTGEDYERALAAALLAKKSDAA